MSTLGSGSIIFDSAFLLVATGQGRNFQHRIGSLHLEAQNFALVRSQFHFLVEQSPRKESDPSRTVIL